MIKLKDQKKNRKENEIFYYIRQSKNAKLNWRYVILWCCNFLIFKSCNFTKFLILKNFVKLQHQLTYSPCIRDRKFSPTFFQSQPNSFSCHSIYVKEWHKTEFGWLWKNVGENFPSQLHGLYVKKPKLFFDLFCFPVAFSIF